MMRFPRLAMPIAAALVILCLNRFGFSQSVFSAQGIGEFRHVPSARLQGMGGGGIAFLDSLLLYTGNPALPSSIHGVRLAISGGYRWIDTEDNVGSDTRDYAEVQGAAIAIPFYNRWTFCASIDPFTIARAKWHWPKRFGTLKYEEQYEVSGGFTRGLIGISFPVGNGLQLGGGTRILFGTVDQVLTINFGSTSYRDAQYRNQLHSLSVGFIGGAVWEVFPGWSIGGMYYSPQSGDGTSKFSYIDSDSVRSIEGTLDFPAKIGVGFSAAVYPRIRVVGDVLWTQWEDAQISLEDELPLADTWRMSFGAEFQPLYGGIEPLYNRMYYRLGVSSENHYIENASGDTPRLTLVHAGLGVPLKGSSRRLDFAVHFGMRGGVDDFGAEETVFGISVTLESAEKWFIRRR